MHLYAVSCGRREWVFDAMKVADQRCVLYSFAFPSIERLWRENASGFAPRRVLIDSGAFPADSRGFKIVPEDYAVWAREIAALYRGKVEELRFINLDVIGDQLASWVNWEKLDGLGCPVMPVVTYGAGDDDLRRAAEIARETTRGLCLGGLVPYSGTARRPHLQWWLDRCFRFFLDERERTGHMPRVHLLGIASAWVLQRYPAYSSDSASWNAPEMFGKSRLKGVGRQPKYSSGGAGEDAVKMLVLADNIRRLQQVEEHATKLWAARGITFPEQAGSRDGKSKSKR